MEGVKKTINRTVRHEWFLPLMVFVIFLSVSFLFYGPAYLSDEVGYLNKAAVVAGQTVHTASSWYGGYSLMVSPAFFLSSDPFVQWRVVMVLNALMWAGSAWLLRIFLRILKPKASNQLIAFATFGALLYPSWLTMSGYAFSTSGFVLILLASLVCLLKSNFQSMRFLIAGSLLAGYLFWIHPLGAVYTILVAILLLIQALLRKNARLALICLIPLAAAAVYSIFVSPAFNHAMNATIDGHYASTVDKLASQVFTLEFLKKFGMLLFGLGSSLIVSTFGVIVFAGQNIFTNLSVRKQKWPDKLRDPKIVIPALVLMALLGTFLVNVTSSASNEVLRLDEWVYGRYTDMYLLPLLGFGICAVWSKRAVLYGIAVTLISGAILGLMINPTNTDVTSNNKVNIAGFWPAQLTSIFHVHDYLIWMIVGCVGLIVILISVLRKNKAWLWLLIIPILLTDVANLRYHTTILKDHSTVSSLYDYLKMNYSPQDCIGFTPIKDPLERFSLYSYYLHGYTIQQMTITEWQARDCKGPYFTYDAELISDTIHLSGIELKTKLIMLTRDVPSTTPAIFR